MSTPQPLLRRFAYNGWANAAVYRSLEGQAGPAPERAVAIFGHILAAERLWLGRLGQIVPPGEIALPVWPALSISDYAAILNGLASSWPGMLTGFVRDGLGRIVTYRNTLGQDHSSTVGDILEHLLLHGAYHRGQVATLLGRAGLKSVNTDFIHWTRSGEPAPG
jgi:uncharacterized damage-inducible protein DinB